MQAISKIFLCDLLIEISTLNTGLIVKRSMSGTGFGISGKLKMGKKVSGFIDCSIRVATINGVRYEFATTEHFKQSYSNFIKTGKLFA